MSPADPSCRGPRPSRNGRDGAPGRRHALVLVLALAAAACARQEEPRPSPIVQVALTVRPAEGGSAFVTYDSTGGVHGGHMPAEANPVLHEDDGSIPRDSARAIFTAAMALGDSLLYAPTPPGAGGPGTALLQITFYTGRQTNLSWPVGGEHPDPRVRALVAHLMANRIGGW